MPSEVAFGTTFAASYTVVSGTKINAVSPPEPAGTKDILVTTAGAVLFAIFAVLHLLAPSAIAFGDARIAGPVGTALGWWGGTTVIVGLTVGFVAAAVVSLILIAVGRLERRGSVPLGSYLSAGAAIVVWAWH